MRLLIRCDASPALGAGHAMRCLALAEQADAALFAMRKGASLIANRGYSSESLGSDHADFATIARREQPDWIVVDLGTAEEGMLAKLVQIAPVLRMDDSGFTQPTSATLILNPNVGVEPRDYPGVAPAQLLLGPRYVLLRKTFTAVARGRSSTASVFVGFGGSDSPNLTLRVISLLAPLNEFRLEVAVGPKNIHKTAIASIAGKYSNVVVHIDSPDLAAIMASCELALTASSGMLWELMAVGTPVLAFAIADNQRRNLGWLGQNSVGKALGWHADVSDKQIVTATRQALNDAQWRKTVAQQGGRLVDGRGAARVLEKLASLMPVGK